MSTVVYQELQPCYESTNFIESTRLSLKLNAPKDNLSLSSSISLEDVTSKLNTLSNSNMFGWNGIEHVETFEKEEPIYVHPLVKRSSSKLSQKSLEMCTESLGCETGTCIFENHVFLQSTMLNESRKTRPNMEKRKEITQVKFPPPLTSISGPNSIQVKPVREHGRLVINAVSSPAKRSCLQAERSNGRLKLSLVRDYSSDDEDNCDTSLDSNVHESCVGHYDNDDNDNDEGRSTEDVCKEFEVNEIEDDVGLGENSKEVKLMLALGVKVVSVKIKIPSRCNEGQGNKRIVNWVPFWVVA